MIQLTFLYDEYIDRPKLTEQKNAICVYSSSPHKFKRLIAKLLNFYSYDLNALPV